MRRFTLVVTAALLAACQSEKAKPAGGGITMMGSGSAAATAGGDASAEVAWAGGAAGSNNGSAAAGSGAGAGSAGAAPSPATATTKLVIGGKTTCALLADATVRCWGDGSAGQLGNGTTRDATKPVPPKGLAGVKDLVMTATSACALKLDGTVACWGTLADGAPRKLLLPTPLAGISGATRFVGDSCVAVADDHVMCWRGAPVVKKPGTPQLVPELAKATSFVDGLATFADGTTRYVDKATKQLVPAKLANVVETQSHPADDVHCGRLADGTVQCFGNSLRCKLGVADPIMSPAPGGQGESPFTVEPVTLQLPPARELALDAGENLCAVTNENQLTCIDVGDETGKRCGKVTTLLESVRTVSNTCALLGDGSINCWIFDPARRRTLVAAVAGIAGASQIAVGPAHGCAITASGVFCWGSNDRGQLGRGAADKDGHPEALPVAF